MTDFGDPYLDAGDILNRKDEIWEEETLADEDWEFLRFAKELDDQLYGGLEGAARNGTTLVLDDEFEDYAMEMADSIGAVDSNADWPLNRIDWEAAADDLKMDYTSIDVGDYEYWVRQG